MRSERSEHEVHLLDSDLKLEHQSALWFVLISSFLNSISSFDFPHVCMLFKSRLGSSSLPISLSFRIPSSWFLFPSGRTDAVTLAWIMAAIGVSCRTRAAKSTFTNSITNNWLCNQLYLLRLHWYGYPLITGTAPTSRCVAPYTLCVRIL